MRQFLAVHPLVIWVLDILGIQYKDDGSIGKVVHVCGLGQQWYNSDYAQTYAAQYLLYHLGFIVWSIFTTCQVHLQKPVLRMVGDPITGIGQEDIPQKI